MLRFVATLQIVFIAAVAFVAVHQLQSVLAQANSLSAFPQSIATGSTFSDISRQVALGSSVPLRVSAQIDWRNKKNIDLVGIREDNPSCIEVRAWKRADEKATNKGGKFSDVIQLTPGCTNATAAAQRKYVAAVAVDINRDGLLDIVATHETNVDLILQLPATAGAPSADATAPSVSIQADVLKFPPELGTTPSATTLLRGSSANVLNYFGQCAALDIAAINGDGTMIVFRNAIATPPSAGGASCTSSAWAAPANVTFVPELGTIVKNVVAAGAATVDLDGDCAAEFVFATRNAATAMMEIRVAPLAARTIDATSTKRTSAATTTAAAAPVLDAAQQGRDAKAQAVDGSTEGLATDTTLLLTVPDDFGPPTWADFDADGAIDVAFAVCVERLAGAATTSTAAPGAPGTRRGTHRIVNCSSPNNFTGVLVIRNENSGVCSQSECCKRVDTFSFASITHGMADLPMTAMLSDITHHVSAALSGGAPAAPAAAPPASPPSGASAARTCYLQSADPAVMPLKIRTGDLDDDSKCDAVVSSTCGPLLLRNTGTGTFTGELIATPASTTVTGEDGAGDLAMLSGRDGLPFFFDVNDDGRLDVIVTHRGNFSACIGGSSGGNASTTTTTTGVAGPICKAGVFVFWHRGNDDRTNYFITAATLNAAKNLPDAAWGAVQPGATVRFQHLDIDNNVHAAGGTQMGSTAFFELGLARPHFGIGLTFASVMMFASGFQMDGKVYSNSWPSVYLTPNSQILCNPYPVRDPASWVIRLYLIGDYDLELVLIAWLVALTVIGVPILALGVREVSEDRRSFAR